MERQRLLGSKGSLVLSLREWPTFGRSVLISYIHRAGTDKLSMN